MARLVFDGETRHLPAMTTPCFFGYGSLVNRATHAYADAHAARIRGWRRAWRHTPLHPFAFLTVEPDPGTQILGLIAAVPGADWAALDEREIGYLRVPATDLEHERTDPVTVELYHSPADLHGPTEGPLPILLSYLDVVVQGFLDEYGEDGVTHFFDTTSGWDAPVLNDRASPDYPRHMFADDPARALSDLHLTRLGCAITTV